MKQIWSTFKWIAFQAFLTVLVYLFIWKDVQWAYNLRLFLAWVGLFATIIVLCCPFHLLEKERNKGTPVPCIVSDIYDIILICILASFGYYFIAAAQLLSIWSYHKIYDPKWKQVFDEQKRKKKEEEKRNRDKVKKVLNDITNSLREMGIDIDIDFDELLDEDFENFDEQLAKLDKELDDIIDKELNDE